MQIKVKPSKDFLKAEEVMKKIPELTEQASRDLNSDIIKRVPPKVKKAVKARYGVDNEGYDSVKPKPKQYKIDGGDDLIIVYEGEPLTLSHFHLQRRGSKMRRKKATRAPGEAINGKEWAMIHQPRPYTVYAQVIKGQKVPVPGHNVFIYERLVKGTGDESDKAKGLAMDRLGKERNPIKVIKTVSVPQMIANRAALGVQLGVEDVINSRRSHQLNRLANRIEKLSK